MKTWSRLMAVCGMFGMSAAAPIAPAIPVQAQSTARLQARAKPSEKSGSKYMPHQGAKEKARRVRQAAARGFVAFEIAQ